MFLNLAGPEALINLRLLTLRGTRIMRIPMSLYKNLSNISILHIHIKTNGQCEFGAIHDKLIRDRLVCDIYSDIVCTQLLKEKKLTLNLAIEICMLHEQ